MCAESQIVIKISESLEVELVKPFEMLLIRFHSPSVLSVLIHKHAVEAIGRSSGYHMAGHDKACAQMARKDQNTQTLILNLIKQLLHDIQEKRLNEREVAIYNAGFQFLACL